MHAMAIPMYQVPRKNLQSADLDWFAELTDVSVHVGHSDATGEEVKP